MSAKIDGHQFHIEERKERVIRQNRIDLEGEKCFLEIDGQLLQVTDCSTFGLAFKSKEKYEVGRQTSFCTLTFNGYKIGEISLKVIRVQENNSIFKVGCEIIGQPIDFEKISGIRFGSDLIAKHNEEISKYALVPDDFRRLVSDMKVWLLSLKSKVDQLEKQMDFNRINDKTDFENTVANIVGDYIVQAFEPSYISLDKFLKNSNDEVKELSFEFFRKQMIDLLIKAPFHNRAYTKPLGYAGDYQMMNQIYSNEGMGDTLFSKCLHLYFISAPESRAVRNRAEYLYEVILSTVKKFEGRRVRILSVASGPAFEMQNFISRNPSLSKNVSFTLLDQDTEALQHAQKKIKIIQNELNINLDTKYLNKAIKHVIAKGLDDEYDLIYSAGLFDYFTDPVAYMAAKRLHDALSSDGKLIIGNFSNSSLGQITMDIALDWHLIYRSSENLKSLFGSIGNNFYIESEKEGINLFCHISK